SYAPTHARHPFRRFGGKSWVPWSRRCAHRNISAQRMLLASERGRRRLRPVALPCWASRVSRWQHSNRALLPDTQHFGFNANRCVLVPSPLSANFPRLALCKERQLIECPGRRDPKQPSSRRRPYLALAVVTDILPETKH